jgi:hypothetical protein
LPNHLKLVAASCGLLTALASPMAMATEAPRHVYLRVHIDINKDGYFFDPLPIDMTVAEATKVACVAFTNDDKVCTDVAAAMGRRAHINPHDSRDGDRHTGTFLAPAGYEICRARIRPGVDAVAGGSSIAASYIRNTDRLGPSNDAVRNGLGYDIRLGTAPGREKGIHAVIDLDFVEAQMTADPANGCALTGSSV